MPQTAGVKNKHWKYAGFFAAGTFLGGWVLGVVGTVVGRFTRGGVK